MNKKVLIGLGVLAVAGIGFYMWKKKQGEDSSEKETAGATEAKPEEKAGLIDSGGGGTETPRYKYKKKLASGTIVH